MNTIAIINGRVVLPERIERGLALVVREGKIEGLVPEDQIGAQAERVDAGGRLVTPGLIDIHTHGALGHSFNQADAQAWEVITREQLGRGVTSLLATLSTGPMDQLTAACATARAWMQADHPGCAQVLGVHSEGPFLSPGEKGAQDPNNIQELGEDAEERLLAYSDVLKIVAYAPEIPGALRLTDRLKELGIVAAAGHSSARDTHVQAAIARGMTHTVHVWSSQSSVIREGPWRKPGLLESTLTFDELTAEMISDNRHLPPTLMKLAYKCKGPDKLCVISDATTATGFAEGTQLDDGGVRYEVLDGVAILKDRTAFAGSITLLNQMIPILLREVGIPLVEAIRMASLTPARVIGVDGRKGSLEAGKDADVAVYDEDFTAWKVMVGGAWVL